MSRYIHNFTCVLLYICKTYVHCFQTTYRHLWTWHTFYDHHDCFLALVIVVLNITVPLLLSLYSWYILMRCKSSIFFFFFYIIVLFIHICIYICSILQYIYATQMQSTLACELRSNDRDRGWYWSCHYWKRSFAATNPISQVKTVTMIVFVFEIKLCTYRLLPWFWIEHCNP